MIYAEFIARDRGVPPEMFRHFGRQDWQSEKDVMVANLARTMKIGPGPQAMCWWRISGFDRMDEWEAHFRTPAGRLYMAESPVARALDFYRAGLYDIVFGDGPVPPALHLVEFFDPAGRKAEDIRAAFAGRQAGEGRLACLLARVGLLGPDPGGIALWSFPSYVAAERFARCAAPAACAVREAGFYRDFDQAIP